MMNEKPSERLFDVGGPSSEWSQFRADGFDAPVPGIVYRTDRPPSSGMGLGGISTGCLDIEAWGVIGFSSIFCPFPRYSTGLATNDTPDPWFCSPVHPWPTSPRSYVPFLGLATAGLTWVLVSKQIRTGGSFDDRSDDISQRVAPAVVEEIKGVKCCREIHYWGHYPVVDIEYETDCPIGVGLRAWAPFIPGDAVTSNTPGAVFEVWLRNDTDEAQEGRLAFSFPGPTQVEAQMAPDAPTRVINIFGTWKGFVPEAAEDVEAERVSIDEDGLLGVRVSSPAGTSYCLAALGSDHVERGGALGVDDWAGISESLPKTTATDFGASLGIDFSLAPHASRTVRIVLSWYQPTWYGGGAHPGASGVEDGPSPQTQMYAARFADAVDVARLLARERASLMERVLSWQGAVYADASLPPWLTDVLVNCLGAIPEASFWSQPEGPVAWAGSDGCFMMLESARRCPAPCVIQESWLNWPLVWFFPELAENSLRMYARAMSDEGAVPIDLRLNGDPRGYETFAWTDVCFVDLVGRLWQRTGDEGVLNEFYAAVKRTTAYTLRLTAAWEEGKTGQPNNLHAVEVGIHLAMLRMAERMAETVCDVEFADQCRAWFGRRSALLEDRFWTGEQYRLSDAEDGIGAQQLNGELFARMHGLAGVLPEDKARSALELIRRHCLDEVVGVLTYRDALGNVSIQLSRLEHRSSVLYGSAGVGVVGAHMTGLAFLHMGEREDGIEALRRNWYNVACRHGHLWDLPETIRPYSGRTAMGTDYPQSGIAWTIPAALAGQDIAAASAPGDLIARVLDAGKRAP